MGNPHDAADGLQDGLVAAYRRADSFRGDAAVTTWLHRVVVNACLDRLRAAKVRRADALPDDLDDHARPRVVATPSTSDRSTTPSRPRSPTTAGAPCWPPSRPCPPSSGPRWCWSTWRATPVAEVAVMLDCAEGTVKSRCSRGRDRLAALLRDRLADVDGRTDPRDASSPGTRRRPPPVRSPHPRPPRPAAREGGAP